MKKYAFYNIDGNMKAEYDIDEMLRKHGIQYRPDELDKLDGMLLTEIQPLTIKRERDATCSLSVL